jgi:hypothetical protein
MVPMALSSSPDSNLRSLKKLFNKVNDISFGKSAPPGLFESTINLKVLNCPCFINLI